jgi:cytochrome P450/NADPH-cytochrome P450 reductase
MEPREDTLLDNKYLLKKGEVVSVFFTKGHLDPEVYRKDADLFRPERMLDENFERLQKQYPSAWKPFGNGARACIGRPFAWQEMLLTTALLLQNFNFSMHDPGYKLRLSETLTIKPKDFYIKATLRHGITPLQLEHQLLGARTSSGSAAGTEGKTPHESNAGGPESEKIPFHIYYGSNSGTCESLAQRLASNAISRGFRTPTVASLDSAKENVSTGCPVIIITSSYEGQPPDNAAQFVAWLKTLQGRSLDKVSFAVFGVGNREWANTFLKVPKLIDSALQKYGASQITDFGSTDLSDRDPFTDFEQWENDVLWPALEQRLGVPETTSVQSDLVVQIAVPRISILRQEMNEAIVTGARALTGPGVPLKKHIEIQLPNGATYRTGDYICVLPINPRETVSRVLRRFRLPGDAVLTIEGDNQASLPTRQPASAWDILSAYLELSQPATERHILALAQFTTDSETKQKLDQLAGAVFHDQITKNRVSVLDLLERFDKVELPLSVFLRMLPPMRIRQ